MRAKNQALKDALADARKREKATAQILRVIGRTANDLQPAFEAIVNAGARCFENCTLSLRLVRGDFAERVASTNGRPSFDPSREPIATGRTIAASAIRERKVVHLGDLRRERGRSKRSRQPGYAAILAAPLMQHGKAVGVLSVTRPTPGQFSSEQAALLKTFASQAVIAIENTRLFNELRVRNAEVSESLEQQTATAEILKVISLSPTGPQPVFDAIVRSASRLLGDAHAYIRLVEGGQLVTVASSRGRVIDPNPVRLGEATPGARAIRERRVVHVADIQDEDWIGEWDKERARRTGRRADLHAPMLTDNGAIGTIAVRRNTPGYFADKHVALLQTFAAQAVIAIENARLFNELRARNAELLESLEQQTATTEILKVISLSPTGPQPVFDAIVRSASRLLGGAHAFVRLLEEGHLVTAAMSRGPVTDRNPVPLSEAASPGARAILERRVVHVADILAEEWVAERHKETARRSGRRADLHAPMLTDNGAIGTIAVWRSTPGFFSDRQVELLQTFAAQAVIAIENVRKTHESREALEQLSATADVLKVMTSSPTDAQPVFDAIVSTGLTLFGGATMGLRLVKGNYSEVVANTLPLDPVDNLPVPITEARSADSLAIRTASVVHVPDLLEGGMMPSEYNRRRGIRAMLSVPLLRDNTPIGALSLSRATPGPFPQKQIDLLKSFADQAVIAIETANQFHEIQQKSRQLEAANEHKSRFLAAASHDLRQPMHALQMFVESLHHEIESPQRARPLIGRLQDSIAVMSGMLDTLLDISELETGGTKPALSSFAANSLLRRIENTFSPIAAEHGLRFRVVGCEAWVRSDPELLARIVENFVSNAIKYTRSGGVVVGCRRRTDGLSVEVWDSGAGIPSAHHESIFQEFYQVDNPARDRRKGLGLGLAIADRLARLLDHRIRFRSVQGRGSMFAVDVPSGEYTTDASTPIGMIHEALTQFQGIRVGLVDDETEIVEATKQLLERWGCTVIGARSEAELLEALRREPGAPDFLICDYQLSDGDDGLSAIRSVHRAYGTSIPAVVISGNTTPELRTAASDAGITLLLKPVAPSRLRQVMQRLVAGQNTWR
jgi:GAF domain-containing protein/CheY-like chemotaxis protein/anti-sigma regulatory factor (Ser/Thr protein kinase)